MSERFGNQPKPPLLFRENAPFARFPLTPQPASAAPGERPIEVRAVLEKYRRRWPWYVVSLLLAALGAVLYLRYTAPEYKITATLLIKDEENGALGPEQDLLFNDLGLLPRSRLLDNEIQILKSRQLMTRVVDTLGLTTAYFVKGRVNEIDVYRTAPFHLTVLGLQPGAYDHDFHLQGGKFGVVFSEEKSSFRHAGVYNQPFQTPFGRFLVKTGGPWRSKAASSGVFVRFAPRRAVVDDCLERLTVKPAVKNSKSTTVEIAFTDTERQRGADVVNGLIEAYNQAGIRDKNAVATNTIAFIDERLGGLTGELSAVERDVETFKRTHRIADLGTETTLFLQKASDTETALRERQTQMGLLGLVETYLKSPQNQRELVPTTLGLEDPTLLGLVGRFNEVQLHREKLLRSTREANPLVVTLDDQLTGLRARMLEVVGTLRQGLRLTTDHQRQTDAQLRARVAALPRREREFAEISRQQAIKSDLVLYLLKKKEEASLSLAMTTPGGRLVDAATASLLPIGPRKLSVFLLALALGLIIPTSLVAVGDLLNDKVTTRQTLDRTTTAPVLGEVAHSRERRPLVVRPDSRSVAAEWFRSLRANLDFEAAGPPGKVIVVTSAGAGEGKSFVSLNLAASLSLAGHRTVLVDLDLRRPKLAQYVGSPPDAPGLTDFLHGDFTPDALVRPSGAHPSLAFVPSGPVPSDPAELLLSPKLDALFAALTDRFDRIVVDTAPVGLVADARALDRFADLTLLVVRRGFTRKAQLALLTGLIQAEKMTRPAFVFNDVRPDSATYDARYYADVPRPLLVRLGFRR